MRRRLDLAASLVGRPQVLYLDEPTTGLDPHARQEVWGVVRRLVADGATVLLTTQYLEEADQLADGIAVFDHGRVVAEGRPDELKRRVGGQTLQVRPTVLADLGQVGLILAELTGTAPVHDANTGLLTEPGRATRTSPASPMSRPWPACGEAGGVQIYHAPDRPHRDGRFRTTSVRLSGGRAVTPVSPGTRRPLLKA